ncbi:MAG TPA: hypothetical protein VEW93_01695 [Acidimicrobiales bacterium]|nr:hypothetical protein [Acidimicrobiales bacterium]
MLAPDVEDRILAEVRRRVAMGPAGRPDLPALPWLRPATMAAAVLACALVVASLLLPGAGSSDQVIAGPPGTPLRPVPTLAQLAAVARLQPTVALDPEHPYLHLVMDQIPDEAQREDGVLAFRHEQWIAGDGSGRARTLPLPGEDGNGQETDHVGRPGSLTVAGFVPDEVAALPADPDALLAALRHTLEVRGEGTPRPEHVAFLLAVPTVAPEVRVALVAIMDDLGFIPDGRRSDAAGRRGVAFVATVDGDRVEVLLDPRTARPLAIRVDGPSTVTEDPTTVLYRLAEVSPRPTEAG